MSTLKQLRLRISGVKSTQKITRAMKMVAASKLLKAQESKDQAKPYANKMYEVIANIASSSSEDGLCSTLLSGNGKNETHLLVIVSSDRGLCGAFNSNVVKKVKMLTKDILAKGQKYKILCIGKRAFEQLKSTHRESIIEAMEGFNKVTYEDAKSLANKITSWFNKNEFDLCTFIYTEFQNAIKQNIKLRKLIPLNEELLAYETKTRHPVVYEYEPREEIMLDKILPLNLAVQIYYLLLESEASEHGARMTAMDSATNNANEMITKLTLLYNRSRQAAITRELIEIISSAEVV
jgi:F-type H+-transporting ATPase subunit gamma